MTRRLVPLAIAALVILTAAALLALQLAAARQNAGAGATPTPGCAPEPCADAQGYVMQVRTIEVTDSLVRVEVAFTVHGQDSMHAEPEDFRLVDADLTRTRPVFDAPGCPRWPRTDIPDGRSFGPVTVCFRPASTRSPLILSWEPDQGFLSRAFPVQIR